MKNNEDIYKIPILFVDDDELLVEEFLLSFEDEFIILTAKNARDGLELLKKHDIGLVITDIRMPGMSGIEFLEIISKNQPEVLEL